MRKVLSVALMAAMLCLVGMTRDAGATITFSIVWSGTSSLDPGAIASIGTSTMNNAAAGDILTMQIRMTLTQTIAAHAMSINFDTDLADELNLIGAGEWSGSSFGTGTMATTYATLTPGVTSTVESSGIIAGRINSYESGQLTGPGFLPTGSYVIGTAKFMVTGNVVTDGNDVFTGLFNTLVDGVADNTPPGGAPIPFGSSLFVFNNGEVNAIPEPGTVSLLGLGLVGLVLAGRRSRRS